ncbi:MAG TPA: hypothetical protein VLA83_08910 [Candidatus Binatia bacterium]|nr:hypothetical protein [Candidatus Binatia bacterium]
MKAVIAFKGAAEVGLRIGAAEAEAAAVIVQNNVALAEESAGEELVELEKVRAGWLPPRRARTGLGGDPGLAGGNEVPHVAVKHKESVRARIVFF